MIRPATDADGSALYRLALDMIAESPNYRGVAIDSYRLNAMIDNLTKAGTLLVYEDGDHNAGWDIRAFMAYLALPHWLTGELEAADVALYVAPGWRGRGVAEKLVLSAVEDAERRGCATFVAGSSTGTADEATAVVYARAGFTETGRNYRKALVPSQVPA